MAAPHFARTRFAGFRAGACLLVLAVAGCGGGAGSHQAAGAQSTAQSYVATTLALGSTPSTIATAAGKTVQVFATPGGTTPSLTLTNPNPDGVKRVFLVKEQEGDWLHVFLPVAPNGSSGWINKSGVTLSSTQYWVQVARSGHRLVVFRGTTKVIDVPAGIGTKDTPTPGGVYYVTELLKAPNPNGAYGPYAYGLSGYSTSLKQFEGHDPIIGIHGTNEPNLVGTAVSHGCVRVRNDVITRMAALLPLGTPVQIKA